MLPSVLGAYLCVPFLGWACGGELMKTSRRVLGQVFHRLQARNARCESACALFGHL